MENPVHITYEKSENIVGIQFRLHEPIACALKFSSQGSVVLEIPDSYSDVMLQFGLQMFFADELKIDIVHLEVAVAPSVRDHSPRITGQPLINAVRRLCLSANLYFKDRAAFYWGVLSSHCRVANMHVLSYRYKIAYKQLIEIDSMLVNDMRGEKLSEWEC